MNRFAALSNIDNDDVTVQDIMEGNQASKNHDMDVAMSDENNQEENRLYRMFGRRAYVAPTFTYSTPPPTFTSIPPTYSFTPSDFPAMESSSRRIDFDSPTPFEEESSSSEEENFSPPGSPPGTQDSSDDNEEEEEVAEEPERDRGPRCPNCGGYHEDPQRRRRDEEEARDEQNGAAMTRDSPNFKLDVAYEEEYETLLRDNTIIFWSKTLDSDVTISVYFTINRLEHGEMYAGTFIWEHNQNLYYDLKFQEGPEMEHRKLFKYLFQNAPTLRESGTSTKGVRR